MCNPTVVAAVTMVASVTKVTEVISDFMVTMVIFGTSITNVPVDTIATMITKVTHCHWLLWVHEHTRSDSCCGHFLFSVN
jgi:hypothetical protein